VLSESLAGLDLSGTTRTNAGDYLTDPWTFTDVTGNYNNASGSVHDHIDKAPSVTTVTGGTFVFDGFAHPATVTVTGAGGLSLTPSPSYSGTCSSAPITVAQGTSCTASYTYAGDPNHFGSSGSATITITKAGTSVTTVTVTSPQQYSDKVDLSATVASIPPIGGSLSFYINYGTGTQQLLGTVAVAGNSTGTVTGVALLETVAGSMNPAVHTVTAVFTPGDLIDFTGSMNTASLTIKQEDARVTYTGPLFASTSSPSSTAFTVLLTATIQDITAVPADPAYDPYPGDIRNAVARFVDGNNPSTVFCTAPIGLVNALDLKTGTISCNFSGDVGSQSSMQYTVGIIVDDYTPTGGPTQHSYYIRNASTDDQVLTVSQAIPGMITGGGYLQMFTPTKSAGQYPGDAGLKTNFGFNVKYKSGGSKPQGNLNFIIRSGGKVYQIKSNATNTLGISPTNCQSTAASPCQATFTSKANLTDITIETSPISLGGNLNMIVSMTDNGEPGSSDTFAITLYDSSNNILFSSNWNGTKTIEQLLGGGNVVVH
jgi:hypothetical protein